MLDAGVTRPGSDDASTTKAIVAITAAGTKTTPNHINQMPRIKHARCNIPLDTGSDLNLLNISRVSENALIDTQKLYTLYGISGRHCRRQQGQDEHHPSAARTCISSTSRRRQLPDKLRRYPGDGFLREQQAVLRFQENEHHKLKKALYPACRYNVAESSAPFAPGMPSSPTWARGRRPCNATMCNPGSSSLEPRRPSTPSRRILERHPRQIYDAKKAEKGEERQPRPSNTRARWPLFRPNHSTRLKWYSKTLSLSPLSRRGASRAKRHLSASDKSRLYSQYLPKLSVTSFSYLFVMSRPSCGPFCNSSLRWPANAWRPNVSSAAEGRVSAPQLQNGLWAIKFRFFDRRPRVPQQASRKCLCAEFVRQVSSFSTDNH
ncbi:unnamed protein product [Trichogramma brassicae]|uniref:Uncharacterized protein n=1 Tax=Trichogramma brassicae TaxID=86971 RepID=A0A6H5J6D9_9HYME|nr:unnamed protein product [Trichogramma brassicae]